MSSSIFSTSKLADAVRREVAATVPEGKSVAVVLAFDARPDTPPVFETGIAVRVGDTWQVMLKGRVELDDTPTPSLAVQVLYTR